MMKRMKIIRLTLGIVSSVESSRVPGNSFKMVAGKGKRLCDPDFLNWVTTFQNRSGQNHHSAKFE